MRHDAARPSRQVGHRIDAQRHGRPVSRGELQHRQAVLDAHACQARARIQRRKHRRQGMVEQLGGRLRGSGAVPVESERRGEREHRCAALLQQRTPCFQIDAALGIGYGPPLGRHVGFGGDVAAPVHVSVLAKAGVHQRAHAQQFVPAAHRGHGLVE